MLDVPVFSVPIWIIAFKILFCKIRNWQTLNTHSWTMIYNRHIKSMPTRQNKTSFIYHQSMKKQNINLTSSINLILMCLGIFKSNLGIGSLIVFFGFTKRCLNILVFAITIRVLILVLTYQKDSDISFDIDISRINFEDLFSNSINMAII